MPARSSSASASRPSPFLSCPTLPACPWQPRLLVLPGLLAAAAAWNAAYPEDALGMVEQGCLVGGFLSWKVRIRCVCLGSAFVPAH